MHSFSLFKSDDSLQARNHDLRCGRLVARTNLSRLMRERPKVNCERMRPANLFYYCSAVPLIR